MTRTPIAAIIVLGAFLAPAGPSTGLGATWEVAIDARVGDTPVRSRFTVTPQWFGQPDAFGSASATVAGVPVSVLFHLDTGVHLSVAVTGVPLPGCPRGTAAVLASGSAPYETGLFRGTNASGTVTGIRRTSCAEPATAITGTFSAVTNSNIALERALHSLMTGPARVDSVSGSVTARTSTADAALLAVGQDVAPRTLIESGADGAAGITLGTEARVEVAAGTQLILLSASATASGGAPVPAVSGATAATTGGVLINHLRGVLTHTVAPGAGGSADRYRILTPAATLRATGTRFVTEHTQAADRASTTVLVYEGSVEVLDRFGQVQATLSAGQLAVLAATVPRPIPVLPVGSLARGMTHAFLWTPVSGAEGYLLEWTLDPTGFAQANPAAPPPGATTLHLPAGSLTVTEGLVEARLPVPVDVGPAGVTARWRVFPLDAGGQPLPDTTASDDAIVTLQ